MILVKSIIAISHNYCEILYCDIPLCFIRYFIRGRKTLFEVYLNMIGRLHIVVKIRRQLSIFLCLV